MDLYPSLVERHKNLLAQQENPPADYMQQVNAFIDVVRQSGRDIGDPSSRDQLRSYLRFWTTIIYEKDPSGGYRIVDLDEYVGKSRTFVLTNIPGFLPALIIAVGLLAIMIIGGISLIAPGRIPATVTPLQITLTAELPAVPIELTSTQLPPTQTPMPPEPTAVAVTPTTEDVTPVPASGLTQQDNLISITSPQNGATIKPELEIAGTYRDLPPGTSIHVFLRSLVRGKSIFALPEYVTVPVNRRSGEWRISTNLTNLFSMQEINTTFVFTLGLVRSDSIRAALEKSGHTGFNEVPEGVFQIDNQPVTVYGKNYRHINEPRLVYAKWNLKAAQSDLFMARYEDGSDPIQLTNTPDISEIYPSLSPDGQWIAYIGRENIPNQDSKKFVIWLMSSNGEKRYLLLQQAGYEYKSVSWSPDGNALLYTAKYSEKNGDYHNNIFILSNVISSVNKPDIELTPLEIVSNGGNRSPNWISNEEFLYIHEAETRNDIYLYNLKTKQNEKRFSLEGYPLEISIGPGQAIAVTTSYGKTNDIYLLDQKTQNLIPLVKNNDGDDQWMCWTPDGKQIYFTSNRINGDLSIWQIDLKTLQQKEIIKPISFYPAIGLVNAYLVEK